MPSSSQDLASLARTAHDASGLTQGQAARNLGVSPVSYFRALSGQRGRDAVLQLIIDTFTDYSVEGSRQRSGPQKPVHTDR